MNHHTVHSLTSLLALLAATIAIGTGTGRAEAPSLVDDLVGSYLIIQNGLASDDLSAAKEGAQGYLTAFENASASLNRDVLLKEVKQIESATTLEAARASFAGLSQQVKALVDTMGVAEGKPLYLASCSMALHGKGAVWLQSESTLANPYFGSSMLRCGAIEGQLGTAMTPAHDATASSEASCQMSCCQQK